MRKRIWAMVAGLIVGAGGFVAPAAVGASGEDGEGFCAAFDAFIAASETMGIDGSDELTVLDAAQQDQLYAALDAMGEALDRIEATAPAELAADAAAFAQFYHDVAELLRGADLGDATAVEELAAELAAIEDEANVDDPSESAALAVFGHWSEACAGGAFGMPACLLSSDAVAESIGVEIVDDSNTFGGTTLGALRFSVEVSADTVLDTSEVPATLQWSGCDYETADGSELMVGELVDADGAPDPGQFDLLAEHDPEAEGDEAPVTVDGIGDAAYRYEARLYVLAGDHAIVVEAAEPLDVELATATIAALAGTPATSAP